MSSLSLIQAIEKNDADEARKIVSEAKNQSLDILSPVSALRVTAVQLAAWRGWIDLLNALEDYGADVNVSDKLGRCPLHYAAHQGNAEVVEWLIERGATLENRIEINSCTRDVFRPGSSGMDDTQNIIIGKNVCHKLYLSAQFIS